MMGGKKRKNNLPRRRVGEAAPAMAGLNSQHTTNLGQAKGTKPIIQWVAHGLSEGNQGATWAHLSPRNSACFFSCCRFARWARRGRKPSLSKLWLGRKGSRKWCRERRGLLNCSPEVDNLRHQGSLPPELLRRPPPAASNPVIPLCAEMNSRGPRKLRCPQQIQPNLQPDPE